MTSRPEPCVAVITTGRQDFGILRSTILLMREGVPFRMELWAGGMHLSARFGEPLVAFAPDHLQPDVSLPFIAEPPEPAEDAARALSAFAEALRARRPDAVLLAGDRSETMAAGVAATLARTPIIHLHGGEETEGAIDNALRHALTKLAHLHLVTHEDHAARVLQMGEDPENVVVVGVPGVDNLWRRDLPDLFTLEQELGHPLPSPVVLVTLHSATLGGAASDEVRALAGALDAVPATYVITQPNADQDSEYIRDFWQRWATGRDNVVLVNALGERRYWGLLRVAAAVVGNSSSGIIEAPAAGVPVVNVGDRQKGRLRFGGVVDVPANADLITRALEAALAPPRDTGRSSGPVGATPAARRIVDAVASWLPRRTARKAFRAAADQPFPRKRASR